MKRLTDFAPKRVLCVGAHPDDLEFPAGGTLAQLIAAGTEVYFLILTGGSKGSENPAQSAAAVAKLRQGEQHAAANILGVAGVYFENFTDGELENTREVKAAIVRRIRELSPDAVLTWDPQFLNSVPLGMVNHPDHQAAGLATHHAVYPLARNAASFPELGKPHTVTTLMLVTFEVHPDHYVNDVTAVFDRKLKAVNAHGSQTGTDSRAMVTHWGTFFGEFIGVEYGEAFKIVQIEI